MGSESIAHEAEGWMGYWLRGHQDERNKDNTFCLLVDKKKIITILLIEVLVKNMMILVALKKGKGEEMYWFKFLSKLRHTITYYTCLLYTSPSPRDA